MHEKEKNIIRWLSFSFFGQKWMSIFDIFVSFSSVNVISLSWLHHWCVHLWKMTLTSGQICIKLSASVTIEGLRSAISKVCQREHPPSWKRPAGKRIGETVITVLITNPNPNGPNPNPYSNFHDGRFLCGGWPLRSVAINYRNG